jgi:hypothetical protein
MRPSGFCSRGQPRVEHRDENDTYNSVESAIDDLADPCRKVGHLWGHRAREGRPHDRRRDVDRAKRSPRVAGRPQALVPPRLTLIVVQVAPERAGRAWQEQRVPVQPHVVVRELEERLVTRDAASVRDEGEAHIHAVRPVLGVGGAV